MEQQQKALVVEFGLFLPPRATGMKTKDCLCVDVQSEREVKC